VDEGPKGVGWAILAGGVVLYVALQVSFFPSYYSQADEGCYVSMANVFARGRLSGEGLDMNLYRFSPVGDRLVGGHDPGMGWLLAPFTVFGPRGVFALNVLIHLAGFVVFYLLLRRLGIHPAFSLLYLLHPTLWYYSRNIENDLPAGVFFLIGFYCLLRGGRAIFAAGIFFALVIFVRPVSVVFVAPFLGTWFLLNLLKRREPECQGTWKNAGLLTAGALPILTPLLLYNIFILHSVIGLVPGRSFGSRWFSLWNVPGNILWYGFWLDLLYPLMLILFFLYRGPLRRPAIAAVVAGGGFYMGYGSSGMGTTVSVGGMLSDLVVGPRFLAVVIPIMLLGYCWVLERISQRLGRLFWVSYALGMALLLTGVTAITVVHQRHMDQAAYFRDQLFGNTPKDSLILMDEAVRTRISADVIRPRKLLTVFPFEGGPDMSIRRTSSIAELDNLLVAQGEAYVAELDPGGEVAVSPQTVHDRDMFLNRHPHEVVLDHEKRGWRLKLIRVTPGGVAPDPLGPASERSGHAGEPSCPGNPAAGGGTNGRWAMSEGTL